MLLRAGAFSCLPERIVFPVPRISWPGHTVLLMRGVVGWRCCAAPSPLSCCVSRHSLGLLEAFFSWCDSLSLDGPFVFTLLLRRPSWCWVPVRCPWVFFIDVLCRNRRVDIAAIHPFFLGFALCWPFSRSTCRV